MRAKVRGVPISIRRRANNAKNKINTNIIVSFKTNEARRFTIPSLARGHVEGL
jgi:hypothetical protein